MKKNKDASVKYFEDNYFKGRKLQRVKVLASTPNPKIDINFDGNSFSFGGPRIPIVNSEHRQLIGEVILDDTTIETNGINGTATFDYNSNDSILYLLLVEYDDNSRDVFQVDLEILSSLFIGYLEF